MWDKGNHLALVTMVQATGGSVKDPLVKFDSPALDSMMICLLVCLRIKNDSKKSRWDQN